MQISVNTPFSTGCKLKIRFKRFDFLVSLYLHLLRLLPPPPQAACRLSSPRRFYKVGQKEIKVKDSI